MMGLGFILFWANVASALGAIATRDVHLAMLNSGSALLLYAQNPEVWKR